MKSFIVVFCLCILASTVAGAGTRLKDITTVGGVRTNQLVGYGLVIGLNGTGDSLRSSPFTGQSLKSMLDSMGINIRGQDVRTRNIAAVIVTAELPPFLGLGSRIDVTVSSMGDATSLVGGSLVMSPLSGADKKVYAVAQGAVASSGVVAEGRAERLTSGVPTSGRIPNGAMVERESPRVVGSKNQLVLELRNPDFSTAVRVSEAINAFTRRRFRGSLARERDARSVSVRVPRGITATRYIAMLGELEVVPDSPARIVVDERTGTIVIGKDVQISTVAVVHGSVVVRVTEDELVSQPAPFSDGETVVTPQTEVAAKQDGGDLSIVKGNNLKTLVNGLNRIGLKPSGIIAILQAIKSSGALQADLVVQ